MTEMNPRKKRFMQAVHYEMPDRTPIGFSESILAMFGDASYTQGDNFLRPEWAMDQLIAGTKKLDTDLLPAFEYPAGMNFMITDGTRFLMPGKDIPKENGTQAEEHNYMTDVSHYDFIIENGWQAYQEKYVDIHKTEEDAAETERMEELCALFAEKVAAAGLDQFDLYGSTLMLNCGCYILSMLRGFAPFLKDLRKVPDKVIAACKEIMKVEIDNFREFSAEMPAEIVYPTLCRTDCTTMRHDTFEKIVWPEIVRFDEIAQETDAILMIHVDGDYTGYMDLFATLRPKRTILQFDGFTDTFAIADEMVKHELCMWGDIPPQMLAMGKPEEVYNRCMELKKRYGPGLILAAGCSLPPNSRLENILAVKEAAENMRF